MIHFVTPRAGAFGIRDFVEVHATALESVLDVILYEDLPHRAELPSGTYILSGLDQLTPGGLGLVRELVAELRQPGSESRVLNDPARVLLRHDLLDRLYREGLNPHRVARAAAIPSDLRFPVFVREAASHTGPLTPLIGGPAELERELGKAVLKGFRLGDLLVIEYVETAAPNGRYRRYSAFAVAGRIIARELMFGWKWILKGDANDPTEEELLEERAFVLGNPHEALLARIFDIAGIDYGRIDYSMRDGEVVTWEINTNPTIRRGRQPPSVQLPEALSRMREPGRQHFTRTFEAALRSVDVDTPARPLSIRFPPTSPRGGPVAPDP